MSAQSREDGCHPLSPGSGPLHASLLVTPGSPWQVGSIIPVAEVEVEARGNWETFLRLQQDLNAGPPGSRAEFLSHPPSDAPCERKMAGPGS